MLVLKTLDVFVDQRLDGEQEALAVQIAVEMMGCWREGIEVQRDEGEKFHTSGCPMLLLQSFRKTENVDGTILRPVLVRLLDQGESVRESQGFLLRTEAIYGDGIVNEDLRLLAALDPNFAIAPPELVWAGFGEQRKDRVHVRTDGVEMKRIVDTTERMSRRISEGRSVSILQNDGMKIVTGDRI